MLCFIKILQLHFKVYNILAKDHENLQMSVEVENVYAIRQRNNWSKADTVYDAFLLVVDQPRNWFNVTEFRKQFPDWKCIVDECLARASIEENNENKDNHDSETASVGRQDSDEEGDNFQFVTQNDTSLRPPSKRARKSRISSDEEVDEKEGIHKSLRLLECKVRIENVIVIESDSEDSDSHQVEEGRKDTSATEDTKDTIQLCWPQCQHVVSEIIEIDSD